MCLLPVTKLARGSQNGSAKLIPRRVSRLLKLKSHKFDESLNALEDLVKKEGTSCSGVSHSAARRAGLFSSVNPRLSEIPIFPREFSTTRLLRAFLQLQ